MRVLSALLALVLASTLSAPPLAHAGDMTAPGASALGEGLAEGAAGEAGAGDAPEAPVGIEGAPVIRGEAESLPDGGDVAETPRSEARLSEVTPGVEAQPWAATASAAGELAVSLEYDAQGLRCGIPVTFTMRGSGGTGSYKYLQNAMQVWIDGRLTDDADWTRMAYTDEDTFEYAFVASGTYRVVYVMDAGTTPVRTARCVETVTVSDPSAPSVGQVADSMAADCLAQGFATDYEKALYVHDQIMERAVYDHSLLYDGESGVLLRGLGTCESYHRAYALVLGRLGIPCERAVGNGHVWSCVRLDGEWTQVDLTWDDGEHAEPYAYLDHLYFGMTDDMAKAVHSEHKPSAERPCASYDGNYFLRSGEIRRWSDPVEAEIRERIAAGETSFSVDAEYNPYPAVYDIVYPLVQHELSQRDWGLGGRDVEVAYEKTGSKSARYAVSVTCAHEGLSPWAEDDDSHWRTCASCGEELDKGQHAYGPWSAVSQPTASAEGSEMRACDICGHSQTRLTPKLPAQALPDGTYVIGTALSPDKALDVAGGSLGSGANVRLYEKSGAASQMFRVEYDGSTGLYAITNAKSGKALDVDGANVRQYEPDGTLAQRWEITGDDAGGYVVASALDPRYVLDVASGSTRDGANLQVFSSNGTRAQRFFFRSA